MGAGRYYRWNARHACRYFFIRISKRVSPDVYEEAIFFAEIRIPERPIDNRMDQVA